MNMLKMNLCAVLLLCITEILGQTTPKTYLEQADSYFVQGDYESAINHYIAAQNIEKKDVTDKLDNARSCLALLRKGDNLFFAQEFDKAKTYYQLILDSNPDDKNVKNRVATCEKAVTSQNKVFPNSEKIKNEPKVLKVGQDYQGGRIAYLDESGKHGLVITKGDITDEVVGWDQANSRCQKLIVENYDDWRLPSSEELKIIFNNKKLFGMFSTYWSATRNNKRYNRSYYILDFSRKECKVDFVYPNRAYFVRAVRNF